MKIDAQGLLSFLNKFYFTNRIMTVVFDERDENLSIAAIDNDLVVFGIYDEYWTQEEPIGVTLKDIIKYLNKQEEIDVTVSDRLVLKGKGTLKYKPISVNYIATRPSAEVDPFSILQHFTKRCYITKEDKGYIQDLLNICESDIVTFDEKGIKSGDETGNIIRYDIETGLREGESVSVKKETFSNVIKKQQEMCIKFSDNVDFKDMLLVVADDVYFAIQADVR